MRKRHCFSMMSCILVCFFACNVIYASHGESKGGIMDVNWGLSFWTLVTFLALMLLLKRFAWKPLLHALDERERHIRESLENADKAKKDAQQKLDTAQESLKKAAQEARSTLERVQTQARQIKDQVTAQTEKECAQIRTNAQSQVAQAKEKAMQDIWKNVADISMDVAGRVLQKSMTQQDHSQLFQESLAEIRKRLQA